MRLCALRLALGLELRSCLAALFPDGGLLLLVGSLGSGCQCGCLAGCVGLGLPGNKDGAVKLYTTYTAYFVRAASASWLVRVV